MCLIFSKKARKEYKARKTVLKMDDATIDAKVKIQGTPYDRKRKYGPEILNAIQLELMLYFFAISATFTPLLNSN